MGCHNIILNKDQLGRRWLIKNPVYIEQLNITILQGSNVDCKSNNIMCIYENSWPFLNPVVIIPEVRINLIKFEILKNLPKVHTRRKDLYIHIRGGDIFKPNPSRFYAQPPFCFYEKILNNNFFTNIYIISQDKSNIIISALIAKYKNIIHNIHNFEYDISLLSHAYNIVISVSSFALSSIKLNDNLKELWEYDIMRLSEKFKFLHHHFHKFKIQYKIHTMNPSDIYKSKMFSWNMLSDQIKLMLEDKCPYDFVLTEPKK